ncbi:MAG TPA: cation:proton antiporter [Gemmatimonadaceae bacterium]|nr:cation:proton antiporter [Gemmatimonadaceae bacterium]
MPHETALIATVAAGLGAAFLLGLVAVRIGLPPLVGYLIAGIVVGPFTPGPQVDPGLARQLAELGVILLMFGVGLHFSVRDLAVVRRVVVPGAVTQMAVTASVGALLGLTWGWGPGGAAILGLSVGVASTVVLLKGLEQRDRLDSPEGRMGVGWLVMEDLLMVFVLVLLPVVAPLLGGAGARQDAAGIAGTIALAIVKVVLFVALMYFVGRRFVPWLLERVSRLGSRELFTLAVLATALGVGSLAAKLFGVSFALGAFFAGAVITDSELSARAAAEALPMQDAFAVLFFVSVGMLFDPWVLLDRPLEIFAVVALVILWKSVLTFGIMRLLGESRRIAAVMGASLGQIGEFSFIVAGLGVTLGLISPETQAVIIAAALIAIVANSSILTATVAFATRVGAQAAAAESTATQEARREMRVGRAEAAAPRGVESADPFTCADMAGHVVVVGFGRVGSTVVDALRRAGARYVVVEEQERIVAGLRARGERSILGDATRADVLERAAVARARLLVVTAPEPIRARRIVEVAREANPGIHVAVRTHSATEQAFFERSLETPQARGLAVYAEREAALSLAHYALRIFGQTDDQADVVVEELREQPTRPTDMFAAIGTQELKAITSRRPPGPG